MICRASIVSVNRQVYVERIGKLTTNIQIHIRQTPTTAATLTDVYLHIVFMFTAMHRTGKVEFI